MWTSHRGSNSGPKKPRPWMWSRCRWVSRMSTRSSCPSERPSAAIPVPASSTTRLPSRVRTDTQLVLPPYLVVAGPAVGSEPLTPHSSTLILDPPEQRHRAEVAPGLPHDREGRDLDLVPDAGDVGDPDLGVRRAVLL